MSKSQSSYAKQEKPNKKYIYNMSIYIKFLKYNVNYSDRKQTSRCLRKGGKRRERGGVTKKHKEIWGSDGYIHYSDCSDGFMGVKTSDCTF